MPCIWKLLAPGQDLDSGKSQINPFKASGSSGSAGMKITGCLSRGFANTWKRWPFPGCPGGSGTNPQPCSP